MSSTSTPTLASVDPIPLSPVERMFWRVGEDVARIIVLLRIDGQIRADLITLALQHLQQRHPKLRAVISPRSDGRFCYDFEQAVSSIPLEIKDYNGQQLPWREETSRLLKINFPAASPLAAVLVLRSQSSDCSDLIFIVHHAIADGMSAIALADDLLTEYARVEEELNISPRPVLPVVSAERVKQPCTRRQRMQLLGRFMRLQVNDRRSRQISLPENAEIPPQSQWVHWTFSRNYTRDLVRRFRKEKTSLSGVMVAAACCSLIQCLPKQKAVFKCQFPFNLREELEGPFGPVTAQDLGCFVSVMNEFYKVSQQTNFWDLARRAHQSIHNFTKRGGPSFGLNMAESAESRSGQWLIDKVLAKNKKRVTLFATNYGVINMRDSYGSLRLRGCTLIFKNDSLGPSLVMESLVVGQRLNVGLSAAGLEPVFWEQFRAKVLHYLIKAVADEKAELDCVEELI